MRELVQKQICTVYKSLTKKYLVINHSQTNTYTYKVLFFLQMFFSFYILYVEYIY